MENSARPNDYKSIPYVPAKKVDTEEKLKDLEQT